MKKTLAILLALCILFSLAACGGSSKDDIEHGVVITNSMGGI